MCGIIGCVGLDGVLDRVPQLNAARDLLAHRGPDAAGHFAEDRVYLGFRRLAILDVSAAGNQPMVSACGTTWIVFNGEIYNFVELRAELEAEGAAFRTRTDTEVLLQMYRRDGIAMLERLNGMFALAIYDRSTRRLILARDRLGKKPLFYGQFGQGFYFASELKALRALPDVALRLNSDAISLYFRLGWIPNEYCVYEGVRKLPPSTWLELDVDSGAIDGPHSYWNLPPIEYDYSLTEDQWVDQIQAVLWEATRIRLRSDVPLGAFLSGGIDSGIVAAAARSQPGVHLKTMTISFPGWSDDERPLAEQTASALRVDAEFKSLGPDEGGLSLDLLAHFDEPFADPSAHPTSVVCRLARESLTVALSGDGGDEMFAGYGHHQRAARWQFLDAIPLRWRQTASSLLTGLSKSDSRLHRFLVRLGYPVAFWGMGTTIYPFWDWIEKRLDPAFTERRPLEQLLGRLPDLAQENAAAVDQAQRLDIRLYMLDDILVKVDRMSMLHSLEVRSPLLDYRVVETALRVPPGLRVKHGQNKHLLRRLADRCLPQAVACGPKRGFGVPLRQWIFESGRQREFESLVCDSSTPGIEPLRRGAGRQMWLSAQVQPSMVEPLYRILAYKAWADKNTV